MDHNWLASLKPVEEASVRRVAESGFFSGVKAEDVAVEAEYLLSTGELQLRKGWLDIFEMFLPSSNPPAGSKVSILSVNWSETWIRWALYLAAKHVTHGRKQELLDFISDMEICANHIHGLDSPQGSSGRLVGSTKGSIRTSADKLRYLPLSHSKVNTEHMENTSINSKTLAVVVYVGDSSTDYDCLRCADVGVWLADVPKSEYKAKFADVFRPLKYVPPSIRELDGMDESQWCAWAPNLVEVANALEDLSAKDVKSEKHPHERDVEDRRIARD